MRSILALVGRDLPVQTHERIHRALAAFLPVVAVHDCGVFAADLRGTERLLGPAEVVARRALMLAQEAGAAMAAGLSSGTFVARILAERTPAGEVRALRRDEERAFLAALSLDDLPLDPLVRDELRLLGLRHASEFAALPRGSVLDRFGWAAAHAHALASGEDLEALVPTPPAKRIASRVAYEAAIEAFEPLLFALRAVVDDLAAQLRRSGLAVLRLGARLEREDAYPLRLERVILPPSAESLALLRALRWALEERADLRRIVGAELEALAVEPARGRQLGLFAPDGARREEVLGVAAHLRARLGAAVVGRPRLGDAHERLPERRSLFEEIAS